MNITDNTPPPPTRKFTIELDENEFQLLGLIIGTISPVRLSSYFTDETWRLDSFPTITHDKEFVPTIFSKIIKITKKF